MLNPPEFYRPCVGILVFNNEGKVFTAKRLSNKKANMANEKLWQMPQGGIEINEDPKLAGLRELYEETNISEDQVEYIAITHDWLSYDLPAAYLKKNWAGKYKGQAQHWILLKFIGDEKHINVNEPANGQFEAEFSDWRWEEISKLPDLVIDFKKEIYHKVIAEFEPTIQKHI